MLLLLGVCLLSLPLCFTLFRYICAHLQALGMLGDRGTVCGVLCAAT
jgi:hypothetical protein